ncbi:MAG TPA: class I SAM-dependent methyltransferase [Miltoncostaeaceae bacterium]|nr:class I SAM-dependent methyltransferase [Miltoncostaeaceae bacterium]
MAGVTGSALSAPYRPAPGLEDLYDEDYFETRLSNDPKRLAQFRWEGKLIRRYVASGRAMDVGCSTGEFLQAIDWQGERYGMEISDYARVLAAENGVRFDRDIFSESDFFDLVIFRGTIQHLDEPFLFLKRAFAALRPGGHVVFLATPNTNSPFYRLKKTLPFIDAPRNFYVPDDVGLAQALSNLGFVVRETRHPYLRTPYARPLRDHWRFLRNLVTPRTTVIPHAFWRSSMEIVAQKPT